MKKGVARKGLIAAVAGGLVLVAPSRPMAHEIPASVVVRAFVKPLGDRLRLVVRVPLQAMRDIEFPLRGPYLDLARADTALRYAAQLWVADGIALYEDGRPLPRGTVAAVRASLPSDRAFDAYDRALAHLAAPRLPPGTDLPVANGMLDVVLEYPITSDRARFAIRPTLARLGVRTTTVLHFLPASGGERVLQYVGDPGLVRLDPRWHQAALRFVALGVEHILGGIDHLLFVLCLVIPVRRMRTLVAIVTSFTVAHSITLVASAAGLAPEGLWFPPLVEALIALSIVYMTFENIVGARIERRWAIAFGFGLIHGFGFSFALRESLQFAGAHLATSLIAFNVGVELGQLLVLAVAVPLLAALFRHVVAERVGTILLSALVAHTAWHWLLDRGAVLREFRFTWPTLDAASLAAMARGLMLLLLVVGAAWGLYSVFGRLSSPRSASRTQG